MVNLIIGFINNKQGTVSALKGCLILILLLSLFGAVFEFTLAFVRRERIKSDMDFANMASYREIDIERLKRGELYLPYNSAESTFREYLQGNLELDSNLNPMPGSMAVGEVEILDFQIFNMEDTPATCPLGTEVEEMAVYSEIRIPLDPAFYGVISEIYNLDVAITTDLPHDNPFELYGLVEGEEEDWEPPNTTTKTLISQSNRPSVLATRGSDRDFVGNSFVIPEDVTRFNLDVYVGVSGSPQGNLEVRLYNTSSSGLPIGSAITSDVAIHTSDGWARFEFVESLEGGTEYAFGIRPTYIEGSDLFNFMGTSSSFYSNGSMIYTNNGNWNSQGGDLAFSVRKVKYYYQFSKN